MKSNQVIQLNKDRKFQKNRNKWKHLINKSLSKLKMQKFNKKKWKKSWNKPEKELYKRKKLKIAYSKSKII